jgi:hypothetical protein
LPPPRPLHVLLVGEDCRLRDALVRVLEREDSIETVRAIDLGPPTLRKQRPEPGVVLHEEPRDPNLPKEPDPIALVFASKSSEEPQELADSARAIAYLKNDPSIADLAPTVAALARLASAQSPL